MNLNTISRLLVPENPQESTVGGKAPARNALENFSQFLAGYAKAHPSSVFCPTHPHVACSRTSGKGYYRLECDKHQPNLLSLLQNFDLPIFPLECIDDLIEVLLRYPQEPRNEVTQSRTFDTPSPVVLRKEILNPDSRILFEKPEPWTWNKAGAFVGHFKYSI